jgi:hypothetical protein
VSPPTGVVPGAGCAEGVLADGVFAGEGLDWGVDCAHVDAASISARPADVPASAAVLKPLNLRMTSTSGERPATAHAASLSFLDASIRLLGSQGEVISLGAARRPVSPHAGTMKCNPETPQMTL